MRKHSMKHDISQLILDVFRTFKQAWVHPWEWDEPTSIKKLYFNTASGKALDRGVTTSTKQRQQGIAWCIEIEDRESMHQF